MRIMTAVDHYCVQYYFRCISGSIKHRENPDHATFRGKGVNTGLVRQTWGMSLFGPM